MAEKRNSHQLEEGSEPELLNGIHYTGNKGPWFGTRHVMIIMMAVGSGLVLITSTSFSVIIVAMTASNTSSNADIPTYDWTNKGVILSSSIWLGIPIQLVAGLLGKRYGHKWLILGSVLINSIFFMLIPAFAKIAGSYGVMFCRIISGGAMGMLTPLSASINGLWVPAEERSLAGMIAIGFVFVFAIISTISAGQIVASSIGYPGCCYIMGSMSVAWCILWIFLAHQSPATHPRITPEEKKYIDTSLSLQKTEHVPVPWRKILFSLHFCAPVIAGIGTKWMETMMSSVNLIFITNAWKLDIAKSTSTLGVAPIAGLIFGCLMVPLSDFLIKGKYLRLVNARRIFHTVGTIGNAGCLLWMTVIHPGAPTAVIILNMCLNNIFIIAYSVGGAAINILDIAPTFAGIINGFANTISQSIALFAPMTMDWIITDESSLEEWRIIFIITAVIVLVTTIFFNLFATDKREWEDVNEEK